MGVRQWLVGLAVRRVHVLLAEAPDNLELRAAVERQIFERGWVLARSPADADALLVIGSPDTSLGSAIDHVYDQMPGPRARAEASEISAVTSSLDALRADLLDGRAQHEDAHSRTTLAGEHESMDHGEMPMDAGHDHMDHGHTDHGHMDHGDMEMAPSGIPLAEGGDDRDGLEMDRTHLVLGPVLPHWPAGLILRCTLHGDTVMDVEVVSVPSATSPPSPRLRAALHLSAAMDVMLLAGSDRAAERLRGLRDRVLEEEGDPRPDLSAERGLLEHSRFLRWSLGQSHAACLALLDRALAEMAGQDLDSHRVTPLVDLVSGLDLATVRLRIAAAGPDLWHTLEVG